MNEIREKDLPSLLATKHACEQELLKNADDPVALSRYRNVLNDFNRYTTGIVSFHWPTIKYPLYFRAGTSDFWNFQQMFVVKEYGFHMPFTPARILDLGAYVGYAAVFFAERFPHAEIFSVEPSTENFRMLSLNTGAYANIRRLNSAVWGSASRLSVSNFKGGDWGTNLSEISSNDDPKTAQVQALSLPEIYSRAGWDSIDLLKCDIEGAERQVFEACREFISGSVDISAVEIHNSVPGARAAVEACFNSTEFTIESSGEFDTFIRKVPKFGGKSISSLRVLSPSTGLRQISFQNIGNHGWSYYIFDGSSCQIHPTNANQTPAEVSLDIEFNGQSRFESGLSVANPLGHSVEFSLRLEAAEQEAIVKTLSVPADMTGKLEFTVPPLFGEFRVSLGTRMAPGMPTNHQALANWLDPLFR